MKIEELRIGQVVYNEDNERLTVEIISAEKKWGEQVYTRDAAKFGKWYKPNELQEKPIEWVDLGLNSGTLWKSDIERQSDKPIYVDYKTAKETYNDNLPKYWQFSELYEDCKWDQ